jgi:uncharacterized protein
MKAIGIDLAGVETRPTGFCTMEEDLWARTRLLYTDEEILRETIDSQPDVVTIDAPLALPRGRESLEQRCNIHLRDCDRTLIKMGIKFFPLTIGPMRLLTARGMRLRTQLEEKGLRVFETYPGGAQDVLGIPRKGKGLERLRVGLEAVGITGLRDDTNGDELDAATCAFVGILYLKGNYLAIGDPAEMQIILPRRQECPPPAGR